HRVLQNGPAAIGQPNYKGRPEWRKGFDADLAAMRLKHQGGDHQAQSGAMLACGEKWLEYLFPVFWFDTAAIVFDPNGDVFFSPLCYAVHLQGTVSPFHI